MTSSAVSIKEHEDTRYTKARFLYVRLCLSREFGIYVWNCLVTLHNDILFQNRVAVAERLIHPTFRNSIVHLVNVPLVSLFNPQ